MDASDHPGARRSGAHGGDRHPPAHPRGRRARVGRRRRSSDCFGDRPAVVVADPTTWAVAGRRVDALLRAAGMRSPADRPGRPAPRRLRARPGAAGRARHADDAIPVAVGSGTINDLTKLAAHRLGRPYMVVATAASMDGYAAFGASITQDGFKQTMACPAPAAIVADLDILAAAPTPLTAAGYGDLLGKVTAGADWMVADALDVEPIDPDAWALVQEPLAGRAGRPGAPGRRTTRPRPSSSSSGWSSPGWRCRRPVSSRPASGAEHLLSHLWEMTGLAQGANPASHGTKVGIGTVLVTMLYERLLAHDLRPSTSRRASRAARPPRPSSARSGPASRPARSPTGPSSRAWRSTRPPTSCGLRLALLRERWPATCVAPPGAACCRPPSFGGCSPGSARRLAAGRDRRQPGSPARRPAGGPPDPATVHRPGPGGRGRAAGALRRRGRGRARPAIQRAETAPPEPPR